MALKLFGIDASGEATVIRVTAGHVRVLTDRIIIGDGDEVYLRSTSKWNHPDGKDPHFDEILIEEPVPAPTPAPKPAPAKSSPEPKKAGAPAPAPAPAPQK